MNEAPEANGGLVAQLETPLPAGLPAGARSAVFAMGTCHRPGHLLAGLDLVVGGRPTAIDRFGMPRPGLAAQGGSAARSGFWGLAAVHAPASEEGEELEVALRASFTDGSSAEARVGSIPVLPAAGEPDAGGDAPRIAVCMATYEPDPDLFAMQIESLRAQSATDWSCLISDDASGPEAVAMIEREIAGDERFTFSRSPERLGFYRNFERALGMVPPGCELVALADQDDRWHPEKLQVLSDAIGDAQLVYSDQRLTDAGGRVISETFWRGRRNNYRDFTSLMVANTVTGAAAAFRPDLLELALPFPDGPGWQFHDHWLAVCAMARGELAYVDRPLYDYVQHPGAILGQVTEGEDPSGPVAAIKRALRPWLRVSTEWRAAYFFDFLRLRTIAAVILEREGDGLPSARARVLLRFRDADRRVGTALAMLSRPARSLIGRNETLGSEAQFGRGLLWRRFASLGKRSGRDVAAFDTALPPGGPAAYGANRIRRWRSG